MNLSKFFKTSALFGILGGILLDAPLQAMENDGASAVRDDEEVGALMGRIAAVSVGGAGVSSVDQEKPLSRSLPPKVVSDFTAKFQGVRHEYPVTLGNGRAITMKFRLMLDSAEDLRDLQTAFGIGNESQYSIMMRENVDAVLRFTDHARAGKFKWFFYCSNEEGKFVPSGFVFLEDPQVKGWDFAAMMAGPITPTMMIAAPRSSIYATEAAALKPVITDFFKDAISRCGVSFGEGADHGWDPGQILTAFDTESGLIGNVHRRFNFDDYKDPSQGGATYSADLLVWRRGDEVLKMPFIDFAKRLLAYHRKVSGRSSEITRADEEQLQMTYGKMLQTQALALRKYDAYLRSSGKRALNIEGLTWIISEKRHGSPSRVFATMIGQKGNGVQLSFDPEIALTSDAPLAQGITKFFTTELAKKR